MENRELPYHIFKQMITYTNKRPARSPSRRHLPSPSLKHATFQTKFSNACVLNPCKARALLLIARPVREATYRSPVRHLCCLDFLEHFFSKLTAPQLLLAQFSQSASSPKPLQHNSRNFISKFSFKAHCATWHSFRKFLKNFLSEVTASQSLALALTIT